MRGGGSPFMTNASTGRDLGASAAASTTIEQLSRIVLRFRDQDIRAVVETARYSDPRATDYVTAMLDRRRDKIGDYWLRQVSSLDGFRTEDGTLVFEDLLVRHGFEAAMAPHHARFYAFDNQTGARTTLGDPADVASGRIALPSPVLGSPPRWARTSRYSSTPTSRSGLRQRGRTEPAASATARWRASTAALYLPNGESKRGDT